MAWLTGWSNRISLTVPLGKVGDDLSSFPLFVNLTSSSFDDLNAGAQSDGSDIFVTDASGTELPVELVQYSSVAGGFLWIKTDLLAGSDNVLYLYYGNPSPPARANASSDVWSLYNGVWHLQETSGTTFADSKGSITLSANGGPNFMSGKFGSAVHSGLDGVNPGSYLKSSSTLAIGTSRTLFTWIAQTADNGTSTRGVACFGGSIFHALIGDGAAGFYPSYYDGAGYNTSATSYPSLNTWYRVAYAINGTSFTPFGNGVAASPLSVVSRSSAGDLVTILAYQTGGTIGRTGMNETWMYNGVPSTDWIVADYQNQSSPETFYTVSSSESAPIPPASFMKPGFYW